ncbi:hypothetical protein J6590_002466 [Homalodisca vitripennis]|nr:hypothetical protein J6590_002466 [Homalodisca vitripennis]
MSISTNPGKSDFSRMRSRIRQKARSATCGTNVYEHNKEVTDDRSDGRGRRETGEEQGLLRHPVTYSHSASALDTARGHLRQESESIIVHYLTAKGIVQTQGMGTERERGEATPTNLAADASPLLTKLIFLLRATDKLLKALFEKQNQFFSSQSIKSLNTYVTITLCAETRHLGTQNT